MKRKSRILALILSTLMLLTFVAGCSNTTDSGTTANTDAPATDSGGSNAGENAGGDEAAGSAQNIYARKTEAGTLTIGTTSTSGTFDSTNRAGNAQVMFLSMVYESLFTINVHTGELEPQLVDTYHYEDDVTLFITLKDGVYFSNGMQLTAEDVLFSMEYFIGSWRESFYLAYDFENSYVDPDDLLTFVLKYHYPYGPGLSYLYDPILCKGLGGNRRQRHVVGSAVRHRTIFMR